MVLRLKAWKSRSPPGPPNRREPRRAQRAAGRTASPSPDLIRRSDPGTSRPNSAIVDLIAGWSSPVARQAHNLKVIGSNPIPATTFTEHLFGPDPTLSAPP